jgi:hypothetical protein
MCIEVAENLRLVMGQSTIMFFTKDGIMVNSINMLKVKVQLSLCLINYASNHEGI